MKSFSFVAGYQRIALFVFFDAIERDLIQHIRDLIGNLERDLLSQDERDKATIRALAGESSAHANDLDLIPYVDLGDKIQILMRHRGKIASASSAYFYGKLELFKKIIPVRNATMHSRPLTTDEYSIGFAAAQDFLASPTYWPSLVQTYNDYAMDPAKFAHVSIRYIDGDVTKEVFNNLPKPDYEDTGFLPRRALEDELTKKIRGRHPVITVLGEGGNGKTALALQTLHSLVASNDHGFDAIIWVSAKSNILGTNEIRRIEGTINDSLGLFSEIASFEPGEAEPLERVRRLLAENKILLVIDNLETVIDKTVIEFASDIPGDSKLLLTSRVPLGSDLVVKVGSFSEQESLAYFRRVVQAYNVTGLQTLSEPTIRRYLTSLGSKPLLIKWFILGVASGLDPARIVAKPDLALQYCLENVFDKLSAEAKDVLQVISAISQPVASSVVQYVSETTAQAVESGTSELVRFDLVESIAATSAETVYRLRPLMRAYLGTMGLNKLEISRRIIDRFRGVSVAFQQEKGASSRNKYDPSTFVVTTQSEAVVARKLRHAFILASRNKFTDAKTIIDDLKALSPSFFEVFRISAFVEYRYGDVLSAKQSYEVAFELAVDQPQLHYFFGGFLMRAFGDNEAALVEFDKALGLDGDEAVVLREAARASLYTYDFERAGTYLERARGLKFKSDRDEVIFADLEGQLIVRAADHAFLGGDYRVAAEWVSKLHEFLLGLNPRFVDSLLIEHLFKVEPVIDGLSRVGAQVDADRIESIVYSIKNLRPSQYSISQSQKDSELRHKGRYGSLKERGRTDRFGFLTDNSGTDTYVGRNAVSEVMWQDLCAGRSVTYDIQMDRWGRASAVNLSLV